MRTFEQYIRESYDFRLGGKKRRGFKDCSFSQLEDGDKFYYKFFDDGEYKGKRELKVWDISPAKPTDEKPDAVKSIRFSKVDGDPDIIYTLQLSEEDLESNAFSTDIELSSNRKRIYVWSTELLSEDDAYEIAYNADMKESVDFRLGGKANKGVQQFNYFPKDRDEFDALMKKLRKERGEEGDFNDIDVSNVTDMSYVFSEGKKFNGDISQWDVSNVTDMSCMFYGCENFNGDISNWDVSNVTNMRYMFYKCNSFNQDISSWDVSSVTNMNAMFSGCDSFEGDISNWNVSSVTNMSYTFFNCPIKEEFKPKFK